MAYVFANDIGAFQGARARRWAADNPQFAEEDAYFNSLA